MSSPPTRVDPTFWSGKRVLLTGHTGFKGSWAALWLWVMGARVTGFSLPPTTDTNLFALMKLAPDIDSIAGDLRDPGQVARAVERCDPEIVLHLAAQSQVQAALADPGGTFATNVMGTVNLLEALRFREELGAVVIVTTDKVYLNDETGRHFKEGDPLGGHDPYAASKAAAELVAASYASSVFARSGAAVATARGGNVIGGGDFAPHRIVPDVWRAASAGQPIRLRCPDATRPWQHVLDCLSGYLIYAQALMRSPDCPKALNFGPESGQGVPVRVLVAALQTALGVPLRWVVDDGPRAREMTSLAIDSTLARQALDWRDRFSGSAAIERTAAWYRAYRQGATMRSVCLDDIEAAS